MGLVFESYQILNENQSRKLFNIALAISQFCGICAVLSIALWMGGFNDGGFSWRDPERQFHYHPMFMAMGFIFLQGEAILVYRIFRHEKKKFTKLLHLVIHSIVLVFMVIGLKAVWDSHDFHVDENSNLSPIPNLYSLHSWLGIIMVTGYILQFTGGLVTFFYPGLSLDIRKFFLPFHQLFGVLIFIAVSTVALMGISEHAAWHDECWTKDKEFCAKHAMGNFFGLFIVGYCISVVFIVLNPNWKRQILPEEEALQPIVPD